MLNYNNYLKVNLKLTNASPFGLIKREKCLIKVKSINEQMWYSKFNQTFVNYRIKWNCIWRIKYTRII